jgi:hypothetical protein
MFDVREAAAMFRAQSPPSASIRYILWRAESNETRLTELNAKFGAQ